ncbi:hypothetical protein [Flavobacterium sp. W21_SRS_FM6]|uniref:hypothetical protein n=1 Tax=Flavobacterium sp. W21_SRS_FM6 TaxID=3240268 RepID=UPI003F8E7534
MRKQISQVSWAALWLTLAALPIVVMVHSAYFPSSVSPVIQLNQQQRSAAVKLHLAQGLNLWQQQQYVAALNDFAKANELGSPDAGLYQQYGQQWLTAQQSAPLVIEQNSLQAWAPQACLQQILFVTSELDSLPQASRFIHQFNADKRLASLPICIAANIVFEPHLLPCASPYKNARITCDIKPLAPKLENKQFTHLVVFAKHGKANVHNGIMYLDQQDTYDVLVHELAHFAGFVDEYPLSSELAANVCKQGKAPNLVFKRINEGQIDTQYWQSLKQNTNVALTPARTCDNHSSQAFKPSAKLTFMEYYDVARIPEFYLAAWQQALKQPKNLTPAFINFAQTFEEQPASPYATYWRKRYEQFHFN